MLKTHTQSVKLAYYHHYFCSTNFAQSSKMGTVAKGFDANLANRPFLVLTFGHSGAQP